MGLSSDGKWLEGEDASRAGLLGSETQGLVRELVSAYLEETAPDRRADFDKLFPALLRASEYRISRGGISTASFDRLGSGNVLAVTVSITHALVATAIRARRADGDGAVGFALDSAERELANVSGDPHLVGFLRSQLDARLDRMDRLIPADPPSEQVTSRAYRDLEPDESPSDRPWALRPETDPEMGTDRTEEDRGAPGILGASGPGAGAPDDVGSHTLGWADLVMLVEPGWRDSGQPLLRYRIGSPHASLGLNFVPFESPIFRQDPQVYFRQFYEQLVKLGREADRGASRLNRLHGYALGLGRQLLPAGLLEYLGSQDTMGSSLHILSEEPWIPWELLALNDEGDSEPRFLGEHYAITRWRTAKGLPLPTELPMTSIGLVVPVDSGLSCVGRELGYIRSLEGPGTHVSEIQARYEEVNGGLRERPHDTWHFAGHGTAPSSKAAEWQLVLDRGDHLEPADLEAVSFRTSPLLFLNACAVGRAEFSLTGLAGFADQAVRMGAGAVIGPLWAVHDESAYRFARAFYEAFRGGTSLGEAARQARILVAERRPFDPSRLAYAVFGHPLAIIGRRTKSYIDT